MREGGLGYVVILGLLWISVLFVLKGLPEGNKDYYLVLLLLMSMRDRLRQSRAYKEQVNGELLLDMWRVVVTRGRG